MYKLGDAAREPCQNSQSAAASPLHRMTLLLGMLGVLAGVEKKFQIAFGAG
jgi:hypothetical protein